MGMMMGFLLIFIGIQLNLVQTFTLSQRATSFWYESIEDLPADVAPVQATGNGYDNSPFKQASTGSQQSYLPATTQSAASAVVTRPKQITPPDWVCWPFIFIGAASVFYGLVLRR